MKEKYTTFTIVYILALAQFATPFMFAGVGIALPAMGKELQASGVQLGLIEIVYLGAACAFLLPFGRFADLTDRVALFKFGLLVYTLCTLVIGFLSSTPAIVAFRFIQGISAALIMATNMAILTDAVPKQSLGRAIGINVGAVYLGLSAGPFIAGWITSFYGWRWVFYITFIPLVLAYLLILFSLKSNWKKPQESFDWIGATTIIVSVFLLIAGSALFGESIFGFILTIAGFTVGAFFFVFEQRIPEPLINLGKVKRNSVLLIALILQLLMYTGAFGISFLFSLYLQMVKGLSPQAAGQILVVSPVVMALFAPVCGRLADRYSPQILATIGLSCSVIATAAAIQVVADTRIPILISILVLQGLSFAIFSSPNMAIIMNSVTPPEYGIASALSAKLRSLGMVFSMMVITIFMSFLLGQQMIDTHQNEFLLVMRLSFIVFTVFAGIGTVLSLLKAANRNVKGEG
ncbi:MAG: MFS transporter [Proteobacteria bacterium]|nr:MFS transporter [Pseudomonadota bacterium]